VARLTSTDRCHVATDDAYTQSLLAGRQADTVLKHSQQNYCIMLAPAI